MAECSSFDSTPSQVVVVNWGYCSYSDPGMFVNPFGFDQYFFQARGIFHIWFLRAKSQLFPIRLVWCDTWTHHIGSHLRVFSVRERILLAKLSPLGGVWVEAFDNRLKTDGLIIWSCSDNQRAPPRWAARNGTEERFDEHSSFSPSSPSDMLQGYLKK